MSAFMFWKFLDGDSHLYHASAFVLIMLYIIQAHRVRLLSPPSLMCLHQWVEETFPIFTWPELEVLSH